MFDNIILDLEVLNGVNMDRPMNNPCCALCLFVQLQLSSLTLYGERNKYQKSDPASRLLNHNGKACVSKVITVRPHKESPTAFLILAWHTIFFPDIPTFRRHAENTRTLHHSLNL